MPQNTLETVNELIAGSFGGAAQVLVGQPLDTIKTRAQIAPSSVPFFCVIGLLSHHA
jgi:solute carrier family 25 carnitine/acylcarnitine transporter 20/29